MIDAERLEDDPVACLIEALANRGIFASENEYTGLMIRIGGVEYSIDWHPEGGVSVHGRQV